MPKVISDVATNWLCVAVMQECALDVVYRASALEKLLIGNGTNEEVPDPSTH